MNFSGLDIFIIVFILYRIKKYFCKTTEKSPAKTGIMESGKRSEFITACMNGDDEKVSLLLSDPKTDVNEADEGGMTGFIWACNEGHDKVVSLLLSNPRVDVNKRDPYGRTGLSYAYEQGNKNTVSLLKSSSRIDCTRKNN